ncbi:MAG: hypothetical protein WAT43_14495 [Chitinophagales bacterium]
MKNKILFFYILFCSTLLQAQFKPGDIGFKANETKVYKTQKVKTQKQTVVDAEGYSSDLQVNYYDQNGMLTKIAYDQDTTMPVEERGPEMKDEYSYFPDGRVKQIILYGYDLVDITHNFEYDKKGRLTESKYASAEARVYRYTYDNAGNIIKRIGKAAFFETDDEGNATGDMVMVDYDSSSYTWDDKANLLSEVFYMGGELYYQINYTYNDNNTLNGYKVYYDITPDAQASFTVVFKYDKNGLPEQMITEEEGFRLTNYFAYTFY